MSVSDQCQIKYRAVMRHVLKDNNVFTFYYYVYYFIIPFKGGCVICLGL